MKFRRFKTLLASVMIAGTAVSNLAVAPVYADYRVNGSVEYLDRGISAINTGNGMLISWRFLANDADDSVFKLYRDNELIYTSDVNNATSYLDPSGNSSSKYRVETFSGGKMVSSDYCTMISNESYFDIPLDVPKGSSSYTYSPNDCSVGDVDGDGQYEIFVKWDPSNSQDNSKSGVTGNVYIDCYTLEGEKLWRIDLGKNIRAGAHYTQFLVADFDLDGKAEMTCKTADGTVDGKGKVIGDASKDYRNSSGYILDGPEYYTLFDGSTGEALDTVNYEYPRGTVSKWGDKYGNRVDRFLGAVCCLDGKKPSAVSVRGYYTRMTVVAYDVVDKKLVKRWGYDSGNSASGSKTGYGNGNHNCMPADVDNDGKDELFLGAVCIDDDGSVLWSTNLGHGDAMHVSDLLPDRKGLEAWVCHEDSPFGASLIDLKDGSIIFHYDHAKDTGRCAAGNIYAGNDGAEFWSTASGDVYDGNGNATGVSRPSVNFLTYWDGDLERELLDGNSIAKITENKKSKTIFTADGCESCNSTKATPCLSADIFGDWREELVLRTSDNKSLRVYCTPYTTDYRITTLMHDVQYREQVAGQQTSYNQPPHPSFYLGSDKELPERPSVEVGEGVNVEKSPVIDTNQYYMIKNKNSGLYLTAEGNDNGSNVSQSSTGVEAPAIWKFVDNGDGYFNIINQQDGTKYLDVTAGKTDNGTNIEIYRSATKPQAQLFRLIENSDGSVVIATKASGDKSCVEIINAEKGAGANVQQWERNGHACQSWILETVEYNPDEKVIYGDINNDGRIDSFDIVMMRKEIVSPVLSYSEKKRADVNADGKVDTADAVELQKYILDGTYFTAVK